VHQATIHGNVTRRTRRERGVGPCSSSLPAHPEVGKTTLAGPLARELGLPLLTKDDDKEALFDSLGTGDRDWSRRLGAASFEVLFAVATRLLGAGVSCVPEANFMDPAPLRELPAARLVQVACAAPQESPSPATPRASAIRAISTPRTWTARTSSPRG
jgi:hypothetical protein